MLHIKALGLQVRNMLGSGSFAQVFECYDHHQHKEYAVKMIKKESMNKSRVRAFFKEAQILEAMDHNNIVKFYSFHQTEQYLLIKMELIRGGTLKRMIEKRKAQRLPFRQEQIALFLSRLLEGIRYLHTLNIIHRDLKTGKYHRYKSENILFVDDSDLSSVKIVDFGLSAKLEINNSKNVKAQCGTLLYMAPEIFNKPSYSKSVDLWSCAVITYMMFNQGNHPIYVPGMKTQQFKYRLKNGVFPALAHPLAQNFIQKISKKEYEERYNVNEAIKHPWITRNKDGEIPLSIHQSYKGFDSTHEVINVLRLFLTIGKMVPHRRVEIDQFYKFKVNDFASSNEAVRVYSPSRRRMRDKNNQLFVKMKQIFHIQGQTKPLDDAAPTLKKHESIFSRLFDRQKSFQTMKLLGKTQGKIESSKEEDLKQEFSYKLNTQRYISSANGSFSKLSEQPMAKTTYIDRQIKRKVQNQIEESVNYLQLYNKNDTKRRIFSKKQSFEEKQVLGEKKPKMMKKYSDNYQTERAEEISRNNMSLPGKQLYNRKPQSPLRGQYKPMIFNLNLKRYNQSYTGKKLP